MTIKAQFINQAIISWIYSSRTGEHMADRVITHVPEHSQTFNALEAAGYIPSLEVPQAGKPAKYEMVPVEYLAAILPTDLPTCLQIQAI